MTHSDVEYDQPTSDPDHEVYDRLPRSPRRGSPLVVTLVAGLAVAGILLASVLVWAARQMDPSGDQGDKVASVVVPAGATFADVATLLEDEEIIGSARVMGWYSRFKSVPAVKAGTYVDFRKNSSMAEAVEVLDQGPVPPASKVVTIIPGMWLSDALAEINEAFPQVPVEELELTLLSGQVSSRYRTDPQASWEGYLLPDTYQFAEAATAVEILQKIVSEFDDTLDSLGYDNALATSGHTAAELVTIASLIERETGDAEGERNKISRVIYNRLDDGEPLGIDATFLYALGRKGDEAPLTRSELAEEGPYNSRKTVGLPPTAIALPSADSLEAAISPADGPWIYYVLESVDPRAHFFTDSAREFEQAKARCQDNGWC